MTTDTDLRAYLDTHGQPGAPTAAGWYIFEWRGIVDPLALFVDMLQPGRDPCSGIARHAPLRLAVNRAEGSAGMNSPRSGAGRTAETVRNHHPTVKPIALMRWLVRLVTPPGGVVLDPFTGSGSTGCACALEGFDFLGIDLDPSYCEIARQRIEHHRCVRS